MLDLPTTTRIVVLLVVVVVVENSVKNSNQSFNGSE